VCGFASVLSARASPAASGSATTTAASSSSTTTNASSFFLGIASSPAFVREPEGNGSVERFIRTLKENLLWVRRFPIEELRLALHAFRATYNQTWIVERHRYQTPAAVRAAQLAPLLAAA
jgi:transposase InsO family protein